MGWHQVLLRSLVGSCSREFVYKLVMRVADIRTVFCESTCDCRFCSAQRRTGPSALSCVLQTRRENVWACGHALFVFISSRRGGGASGPLLLVVWAAEFFFTDL
jgi:hypothetical protein